MENWQHLSFNYHQIPSLSFLLFLQTILLPKVLDQIGFDCMPLISTEFTTCQSTNSISQHCVFNGSCAWLLYRKVAWRQIILYEEISKQKAGNIYSFIYEPGHEKTCLMSYANNKGTDQPVHLRNLISAFAVRCLDSVMSLFSVTKISSLMLASVAEQANLSLTWSETPEDTFSHDKAHIILA